MGPGHHWADLEATDAICLSHLVHACHKGAGHMKRRGAYNESDCYNYYFILLLIVAVLLLGARGLGQGPPLSSEISFELVCLSR